MNPENNHMLVEVRQKGKRMNLTVGSRRNYFELEKLNDLAFLFRYLPVLATVLGDDNHLLERPRGSGTVLSPLHHGLSQSLVFLSVT